MRRGGLASAALGSVLLGSALLAGCGSSLGDPGLVTGDAVAVWTGSCAESFPVQCELIAVHVTD